MGGEEGVVEALDCLQVLEVVREPGYQPRDQEVGLGGGEEEGGEGWWGEEGGEGEESQVD